ncbi:MAG: penicillin-binding transpeptidase domain-containing protein [Kineosporiaceae bacterium]
MPNDPQQPEDPSEAAYLRARYGQDVSPWAPPPVIEDADQGPQPEGTPWAGQGDDAATGEPWSGEQGEPWPGQAAGQDVQPEGRRRDARQGGGGRTGLIAAITVAALVGAGGVAWLGLRTLGVGGGGTTVSAPTPTPPGPETIGKRYLAAWAKGDYVQMDALVADESDDIPGVYTRMAERLKLERTAVTPGVFDASTGTLPFTATLTMTGLGDFTYDGALTLVDVSTIDPSASPGASPSAPARKGWRVKFTAETVHPLLENGQRLDLVSESAGQAPARTAVLDRSGKPIASDADLAANVLGTSPGGGKEGSGLLRAFADQLGGSSGRQLAVTSAADSGVITTLKEFPGTPASKVTTTLDLAYQKAAEKALAKAKPGPRAAVVAIDTRTGAVLAMANKRIEGVPTAQNGVYPPGSTFKVITAIAGLEHGLTPSSTVPCPDSMSVVGKVFRNHEKGRSTSLSLTDAFAQSCNTAFISVAQDLPEGALQETARRFGFAEGPGGESLLPISAARGDVPDTPEKVDLAASAIGQGKVQATPLHMASVAAAVASGTWRQPHLTPDCTQCESNAVPEAGQMRTLMRAVVTSGTATGMRSVPGGPVYAKTGTPEWGSDDPPATHGWLIGWQGHTAFAVFVENGSSGAAAAVPVAAAFLRGLPAGH